MLRRAFLTAGALLLAAFLAYTLAYGFGGNPKARPVDLAGATVKVISGKSHGSGVHIGNGYIVTAAHVVGKATTLSIKADDGSTVVAPVLWSSAEYDVALLRLSDKARIGLASLVLSCRAPEVGEYIEIAGSPMNLEFIRLWGRVSGGARAYDPWAEAIVTDISGAGGMSGGPVIDRSGQLVGLHVGAMIVPYGIGASRVGISYGVPGSTICNLMGRG